MAEEWSRKKAGVPRARRAVARDGGLVRHARRVTALACLAITKGRVRIDRCIVTLT